MTVTEDSVRLIPMKAGDTKVHEEVCYLDPRHACRRSARLTATGSSALLARERRRPRQLHPGTRITHYRCFLPDLAGFASYRRGGTDGATVDGFVARRRNEIIAELAERAGFEPAKRG